MLELVKIKFLYGVDRKKEQCVEENFCMDFGSNVSSFQCGLYIGSPAKHGGTAGGGKRGAPPLK